MLSAAGHGFSAKLIGASQVSLLPNLVHLAFGLIGFAFARTHTGSHRYLIVGGLLYLMLWVYGLMTDNDSAANFVLISSGDSCMVGVSMIALGVALSRGIFATRRPTSHH